MKTVFEIKQQITQALTASGIFDSVLSPSDDAKDSLNMREPSAAVFFTGFSRKTDNGIEMMCADFRVLMKFLNIGVNDTSDETYGAVKALFALEPSKLTHRMISEKNSRSAFYTAEISFDGVQP